MLGTRRAMEFQSIKIDWEIVLVAFCLNMMYRIVNGRYCAAITIIYSKSGGQLFNVKPNSGENNGLPDCNRVLRID